MLVLGVLSSLQIVPANQGFKSSLGNALIIISHGPLHAVLGEGESFDVLGLKGLGCGQVASGGPLQKVLTPIYAARAPSAATACRSH